MRRTLLLPMALVPVLLVACGPNYSGKNNEFTLRATIYKVGSHSVTIRYYTVEDAEGKATHWFDDQGTHQIHNNYHTGSFTHSRHTVGHVYTAMGDEIQLSDLRPGDTVVIVGRIRSNKSGKTHKNRPVFDRITVEKRAS